MNICAGDKVDWYRNLRACLRPPEHTSDTAEVSTKTTFSRPVVNLVVSCSPMPSITSSDSRRTENAARAVAPSANSTATTMSGGGSEAESAANSSEPARSCSPQRWLWRGRTVKQRMPSLSSSTVRLVVSRKSAASGSSTASSSREFYSAGRWGITEMRCRTAETI